MKNALCFVWQVFHYDNGNNYRTTAADAGPPRQKHIGQHAKNAHRECGRWRAIRLRVHKRPEEQVIMRKTFKFKMYHSKNNKHLHRQINIAGSIYNHCIALHKRYYRLFNKHLGANKLMAHIAKLKGTPRYSFWKTLNSQAIQEITQRIDKGYRLFFSNLKINNKRRVAQPSFKNIVKYKSFTLKQTGYKILEGNRIRIGKYTYKFSKSRNISGVIKTVTIKRDPLNDLYLCFSCELPNEQANRTVTGKMAGVDFGLKTYLTISDGISYDEHQSPEFFKTDIKQVRNANKRLSVKKKGSNNREKARLSLARAHKRIANRRMDFRFKLARTLCIKYDWIFLEDLNIGAMAKLWGRKIYDLGFSEFVSILSYTGTVMGSEIRNIDRFYPSSKTCRFCGNVNSELKLSDRTWTCPSCSSLLHRDRNAADNILAEGASSAGLGSARRPSVATTV